MSDKLQFVDLIPDKIDQNSPLSQYNITSQKHLQVLKGTRKEPLPKMGERFKHQEELRREMRDFRKKFIIDEPGTGKSCSMDAIVDYMVSENLKMENGEMFFDINNAYFKKFIYIARSKNQIDEFRRQVTERCSAKYLKEIGYNNIEFDTKTKKSIENALTNRFRKIYSTYTYYSFNKTVSGLSDSQLENAFSNCVFFVDEIHNLIINSKKRKKVKKISDKLDHYNSIWRTFHICKNIIKIILTATPFENKISDIIPLINLLLDEDQQISLELDMNKVDLEYLKPILLSLISYVKPLDNGADIKLISNNDEIFEPIISGKRVKLNLEVMKSYMSEFQTKGYLKLLKDMNKVERIFNQNKNRLEVINQQAHLIVYPDGYSGAGLTADERIKKLKFEKVIKSDTKQMIRQEEEINISDLQKRGFRRYLNLNGKNYLGPSDDFLKYVGGKKSIKNLPKLRELSCKYADIIQESLASPGIDYIFIEFVYVGAYTIAAFLDLLGMQRFESTESVFIKKGDTKIINPKFKKSDGSKEAPWRYVLYVDGISPAAESVIFELLNSKDNMHGEYIKYFIATEKAKEGINIYSVVRTHIAEPLWKPSALIQAEKRSDRVFSYQFLIEEKQKKLQMETEAKNDEIRLKLSKKFTGEKLEKEYNKLKLSVPEARIEAKKFRWCAMPNPEILYDGKQIPSSDLKVYEICKIKDYEIRRIMRILKQCSSACQLNKERNILKGQDYSEECDYDKCEYECAGPVFDFENDETKVRNYNLLYSHPDKIRTASKIVSLYRIYYSLTFDELVELVEEEPIYVCLALEEIISKKIKFLDKNGYQCYLLEDNGCFYTDKNYPNENQNRNCSISYYSQYINAIKINELTLNNIKEENLETEDNDENNKFELIVIKLINGKNLTEEEEKFYNKYKIALFKLGQPVTFLEEQEKLLKPSLQVKPGKKSDKIKRISIQADELDDYLNSSEYTTNIEYVHIIDALFNKNADYAATVRFDKAKCKIRLLNLNDYEKYGKGWRYLSENETPVYEKIIRGLNRKRYSEYAEKFGFFGINLPNLGFRIRDERIKNSKEKKGTKCNLYTQKELWDLMWDMKIDLQKYTDKKLVKKGEKTEKELRSVVMKKATIIKSEELKVSGMISEPFEKWSYDRVLYYYNLIKKFPNVKNEKVIEKFCRIVKKEFEDRDQMIE